MERLPYSQWYDTFNRFAGDLYPGRYTREYTASLVCAARQISELAESKQSLIVAHNYQFPELQEVAAEVGDSLGLSRYVAEQTSPRVDFCGVWFMGETAKTIVGERSKVYMPDKPGCSLVESIDHARVRAWKQKFADGIVISYVNTDAATKALSDYICTSRNAAQVLDHAAGQNPGRRILFLPDKFLGSVSIAQSNVVDASLVDLYDGCCHVHAKIGESALEEAFERHPEAELLIHPECGCASHCMSKVMQGNSPYQKAFFLSTEGMIRHAEQSQADEFIVGTEMGMVYRLRRQIPGKTFHPVSADAVCEYMKMNTLEKLLDSLERDQIEVTIEAETARKAQLAIDRMLSIQ